MHRSAAAETLIPELAELAQAIAAHEAETPHEYDCFCQRCGRRAGSRMATDATAPAERFFRVVCDRCSGGEAQ